MGIKLDDKTRILYGRHVIDAKAAAKDHEEWEGACRIDAGDSLSNAPEDQLVWRDVCDARLEIVRDAGKGDLVLRATITRRDEQPKEYERPYIAITLTPVKGAVSNVRQHDGAISFQYAVSGPSHVVFDHIKGLDLEMRIDYKPAE